MLQKLFHLSILSLPLQAKNLEQIILIWRHGDRSPVRGYPNYEQDYGDSFENIWPKGPGQLTIHGSKQHVELGRFLKNRYKNFIPDSYNMEDIYIKSTDVDRTLMSAMANTIGMYQDPDTTDTANYPVPDGDYSIFEKFLPIPIHTVKKEVDYILRIPNRKDVCPIYDTFEKFVQNSEGFRKINEKYSDLFEKIRVNAGFEGEEADIDLFKLWEVADPIQVSSFHGHPLPKWMTEQDFQAMNDLWGYGAYSIFSDLEKTLHTQMSRLNGGLLIKTIQQDMFRILNTTLGDNSDGGDDKTAHKIRVYSAHDTTLTGLFVALDNYNFLQPPYASCAIFELYDDKSLKLFYRNDSSLSEPAELQLCRNNVLGVDSDACLLQEWVAETSHLVVNDEEEFFSECGRVSNTVTNSRVLYLFTMLVTTWLGIVINLVYKLLNKSQVSSGSSHSSNKNYRNLDHDSEDEDRDQEHEEENERRRKNKTRSSSRNSDEEDLALIDR